MNEELHTSSLPELAISGADYFHLLIDRKMRRHGSQNISRIHLQLDDDADLEKVKHDLMSNSTLRAVHALKIGRGRFGRLQWKGRSGQLNKPNVMVHHGDIDLVKDKILALGVDNEGGLVRIDLCAISDGTKHVVIAMHHTLFDHKGMQLFAQAIAEFKPVKLAPPKSLRFTLSMVWDAIYVSAYVLWNNGPKLAQFINEKSEIRRHQKYHTIRFTKEETEKVDARSKTFGSRLGKSSLYLGAILLAMNKVLSDRGKLHPYYWFTIPRDARPRDARDHLLTNMLSFLFFKVETKYLSGMEGAVAALGDQFKQQLRMKMSQRYTSLMRAFKLFPLPIYEAMFDLSAKGRMASFGFSDLGNDPVPVSTFCGYKVVKSFNYPPVPCPPGLSIVTFRENGDLVFVWGYVDEALSQHELASMENEFRKNMLG